MTHLKPPTRWLEESRHSVNVSFLPLKKHFLFLFFIYLFIYLFFSFFLVLLFLFSQEAVFLGATLHHDFTFTFHFHALEKEMATHSSVLAWRIPRTGKSGGLPSMGSHRVRHDWSDLAVAAAPLADLPGARDWIGAHGNETQPGIPKKHFLNELIVNN